MSTFRPSPRAADLGEPRTAGPPPFRQCSCLKRTTASTFRKANTSRLRYTDSRERCCSAASAAGSSSFQPSEHQLQSGREDPQDVSLPSEHVKPKGPLGHLKRFFFGSKLDKERLKQLGMGAVASYGCVSNITYGGGTLSLGLLMACALLPCLMFLRNVSRFHGSVVEHEKEVSMMISLGAPVDHMWPVKLQELYGTLYKSSIAMGEGMAVAWVGFVRRFGKSPLMPGQWKAFLAFYAGFWTLQNFVRPLRFSLALIMAPVFDGFINAVSLQLKISKRNAFGIYLVLLGSITSILVFGSIRLFAGPLAFAQQ